MDNEFNKGIENIKQVRLSQEEKKALFLRIKKSTEKVYSAPLVSTWYEKFEVFATSRVVYSFASIVLICLVGVSALFAAQKSLPGDKLYSLKVDLIEPLKYTVAVGSVAKANVEVENGLKRLEEAEALEAEGRLSSSSENDLAIRFQSHAELFDKLISESGTTTDKMKTAEIAFESKIKALSSSDLPMSIESNVPQENARTFSLNMQMMSGSASDATTSVNASSTNKMSTTSVQSKKEKKANRKESMELGEHGKAFLKILNTRRLQKDNESH